MRCAARAKRWREEVYNEMFAARAEKWRQEVYLEGEEQGFKRGDEHGFKRGDEHGFKRGDAQGEKRGVNKGRELERNDIALEMIKAGEPRARIIQFTKLTEAELDKLQ